MALNPVDNDSPKSSRRTITLRLLMVLGFGGLVVLSVGGVLVMSVYTNFTNTLALLNRQAIQLIDGMQESIDRDAAEGERVVSGLARLYASGELDINDDASMKPILTAMLMSEPVVETIVVMKPDHQTYGLARTPDERIVRLPGKGGGPPEGVRARPVPDEGARPGSRPRTGAAPERQDGSGPKPAEPPPGRQGAGQESGARPPMPRSETPVWRQPELINGVLFHTVMQSLMKDGRVDGTVIASIGAHSLNRAVMEISEEGKHHHLHFKR